ncbi:MAG: hypothetical protein JSV33_03035 [bacterium]|nr:MAG: hypothetical protein JSV33_03035 [bacterium]
MRRCHLSIGFLLLLITIATISGCRLPFCPGSENPYVVIDSPPYRPGLPTFSRIIVFKWHASPGHAICATRYLLTALIDSNGVYNPEFDIIGDLNANPWRYEDTWSPWMPYSTKWGTGCKACVEAPEVGKVYLFAVQAKDICGRVTQQFELARDAFIFMVSPYTYP